MNKRKIVSIITVISIVGSILVFMGNGCSGQLQVDQSLVSGQSESASSALGVDSDFVLGAKTVSVVYSQQILNQLSSCLGVVSPSDDSIRMYESKKGQISVYGTADTITSPMMMAVISISGELCNDLINQEKNLPVKRIFKDWDLTSSKLPSQGQLNDSISRIALSCWQRAETSTERQSVQDAAYSVKDGESQASAKAALMVCTSMLSSLNSLLN